MAVNELFFERFPDSILEFQIQVRPYNALKTRNMRNLNPEGAWTQRSTQEYMVLHWILKAVTQFFLLALMKHNIW